MDESSAAVALQVRGARKAYAETRALDDVSITLQPGEFVGLLGPNGAGKSTLIRAIAGSARLDAGEIYLLGQRVETGRAGGPARRALGVVPQEIALYDALTAEENLRALGTLHGLTGGELRGRIEWALEWTGLAERRRGRVGTYSGGMKRRLNIACGVLHRPRVILLDEPTVGVDPQSRRRIWDMCAELRAAGATLLLTTHQLDEAQQICERILIIDHGRIIAGGSLEQLVQQTVGAARELSVTLAAPQPGPLPGVWRSAGRTLHARLGDVGRELPERLAALQSAGARIESLQVTAPTLQDVFLHLTGRELRE